MNGTIADLTIGDRVRCNGALNDGFLGMNGEPIGVEGTVSWVGQFNDQLTSQVAVNWDNGMKLNLLPGDEAMLTLPWQVAEPAVAACDQCGAPGDVDCVPNCENEDYRNAEMDGVLGIEGGRE